MLELTHPSVGAVYAIPEATWTAINARVGQALLAQDIQQQMTNVLPSYPQLLAQSMSWRSSTFPGLVTHATNLVAYAGQATEQFSSIQRMIAQLGPDPSVIPDTVKQAILAALSSLATQTSQMASRFSVLADELARFQDVNLRIDEELQRYEGPLGPLWPSLRQELTALEEGTGAARSAWMALVMDLQHLASEQFTIDPTFLLELDIQAALSTWQMLTREANAFTGIAAGQQKHVDGQSRPMRALRFLEPVTIEDDVQRLFSLSATGPFMTATLIPVLNQGQLRVTYNWLYSSLNCDPTDSSLFQWVFYKLDDTHVALSPALSFEGMTLYASVRDDLGYQVQVQAPFSADWIQAVGRDETLTFHIGDLLLGYFQGFNGAYLQVNAAMDSHDNHSGYRVVSNGQSQTKSTLFLVRPEAALQSNLRFVRTARVDAAHVSGALANRGIQLSSPQLSSLMSQLEPARPATASAVSG